MDRTLALLAGAGVGAGLMYLFDPGMGRRRRNLARDKAVRLAHEAQDVAERVGRDAANRARGLASGDPTVLIGGKHALEHPFRGNWSPTARSLLGLAGAGLFLFGLTQEAPTACVLGTVGLALAAEGITNAGVDDLTRIPGEVACATAGAAHRAAESVGLTGSSRRTTPQNGWSQPSLASV